MLTTNLKHLETAEEVGEILKNKENVVISCGRMVRWAISSFSRGQVPVTSEITTTFRHPVVTNHQAMITSHIKVFSHTL